MVRFCSKLNTLVVGAGGKLLTYFEKNYKPKSLITYADKRFSTGNLYEELGFLKITDSKPNYFYVKGLKRMSRLLFQKHKLSKILEKYDENLTEVENMINNGYNRIFDCGNLVYVKEY